VKEGLMEVLVISGWFVLIVVAGALFSGRLLAQAFARDRRYLIASGELHLAPPVTLYEEEPWPSVGSLDPVGTLAILLVYLMVLIGLWLAMFAILVARS
jgi:hypothetical protein